MKMKTYLSIFLTYLLTSAFFIYNYLFLPFEKGIYSLVVDLSDSLRSLTPFITIGIILYTIYLFLHGQKASLKMYVDLIITDVLLFTVPVITSNQKVVIIGLSLALGIFAAKLLIHLSNRAGKYSGRTLYAGIVICSFHMLLRVIQDWLHIEIDMTKSLQPWGLLVVICFIMYELVFRNFSDEPESTSMIIPMSAINTLLLAMAICIILDENRLNLIFILLKFGGLPTAALLMCIDRFWLPCHTDAIFLN